MSRHFTLETDDEHHLLLDAVPNELSRGFRLPNFHEQIGISKGDYEVLMDSLKPERGGLILDVPSAKVLRNALSIVLTELDSEFHTRTAVDKVNGQALLVRLDLFVSEQEQKGCY